MAKATRIDTESSRPVHSKFPDVRLGYALLCDRRVPLRAKLTAFAIGVAIVAVAEVMELPVEEIIALIPVFGVLGDITFAGMEMVVGPMLIASLLLPYLTPGTIVDRIRRERDPHSNPPEKPIIDV